MKRFLLVVMLAISAQAVSATDESRESSDRDLAQRIKSRIEGCVTYGVSDFVTVEAAHGVVTLRGWAHTLWLTEKVGTLAASEPGVRTVVNQVQTSFGDEALVRQAVRAIYSDPLFFPHQLEWPVRIVAQNNQLILAGHTSSIAARNRAEYLAGFYTNAMAIDNRIAVTN